eukprot:gene34225-42201_t
MEPRLKSSLHSVSPPCSRSVALVAVDWQESWCPSNHPSIYSACGLTPQSLDFSGLLQDVQQAENGSLFLLHACAHNPTEVATSHT